MILAGIDSLTGTFDQSSGFGLLSGLFLMIILIPSLSVAVRRLHDIDKSGWFALLLIIPLVNIYIIIILICKDGTKGPNRFGPDPKE